MRVKKIVDEDFVNYKRPAMFIGTISCGGKCCIEAGIPLSICQNDGWRSCAALTVDDGEICRRYVENPITHAIVFGGLEPFEQFAEILGFISRLRGECGCRDDVVIYTGYYPDEIATQLDALKEYPNIIVKFGRFIPNKPHRYDEILGVELASDNQYAVRLDEYRELDWSKVRISQNHPSSEEALSDVEPFDWA